MQIFSSETKEKWPLDSQNRQTNGESDFRLLKFPLQFAWDLKNHPTDTYAFEEIDWRIGLDFFSFI